MTSDGASGQVRGMLWFPLLIFAILAFRIVAQMPAEAEFLLRLQNDSAMRLVVIRDLLAGQGWFDLSFPRLGPDDSFQIHWSRLVDGPVAALIRAAGLFTGAARAEYLALTIWPLALFGAAIVLSSSIGARLGGRLNGLVAGLLVALCFAANRVYQPGSIDHHNLQLTLLVAVVLGIVGRHSRALAITGGLAMAYSLAIGVETLPHLAVAGLAVALIWIFGGARERRQTVDFALSLGLGLPLLFVVSAPPTAYQGGFCDGLSRDLAAPVTIGALALALTAWRLSDRGLGTRLTVMAGWGVAIAAFTWLYAPACLSNPYASLDPYLQERWLAIVTEAQSLPDIFRYNLVSRLFAGFYVLAAAGLGLAIFFATRPRADRAAWLTIAGLLAAALVMSFYQVRGTLAATLLAAQPVAHTITRLRTHWRESGKGRYGLAALALLIASLPVTWFGIANLTGRSGGAAEATADGTPTDHRKCNSAEAFAAIAALPPGLISANSNLGAQLLLQTPHRILSAPYHRNEAGMRAQLEISLAETPDAAHALLRAIGADYVVTCAGDPELQGIADFGFSGFGLDLQEGQVPEFLEPISMPPDSALAVYAVR